MVDDEDGTVVVVASGRVLDVLVVEVLGVDDVVVVTVVLVVGGEVVLVVVVVGGDTPSITPPTVVPELGPPKIEDNERPALTSTSVTIPSTTMKAASAEAAPTTDRRQRRSLLAPLRDRRTRGRSCRAAGRISGPENVCWAFTSPTAAVLAERRVRRAATPEPLAAERRIASFALAVDWETSETTVVATAAPMAAPISVPLAPNTDAAAAAATAANAEAATS